MATGNETLTKVRERAVELGVYLPLGAYSAIRDEITEIDSKRVKKLYSQLIGRGQTRLEPVERVVRRRTRKFEDRAAQATRTARKTVRKTTKRASAAANGIAPKLPRVAAPRRASELAITGYTALTASEITGQLKGLTQTEFAKVYKWEKANENRSTILESLEAKFVDLPIPTYDALTVDEITSRLDGMSKDELKAIRRYELDTKNRTTVIEKIDSTIAA